MCVRPGIQQVPVFIWFPQEQTLRPELIPEVIPGNINWGVGKLDRGREAAVQGR